MNRRTLSSLLTVVEFSPPERARKATELIEGAVRGLCEGLAQKLPTPGTKNQSADAMPVSLAPPLPKTPPRRTMGLPAVDDISPNPFNEPEAALETYRAFIYGTVIVSNRLPAAQVVAQRRRGYLNPRRRTRRSQRTIAT